MGDWSELTADERAEVLARWAQQETANAGLALGAAQEAETLRQVVIPSLTLGADSEAAPPGKEILMDKFDPWTERAFGILMDAASRRSTVTYGLIAEALGVTVVELRGSLAEMLGRIGDESMQRWNVALSVLAVRKKENMPSSGFFTWAAENGFDTEDEYKLVIEEQAKVFQQFARLQLAQGKPA